MIFMQGTLIKVAIIYKLSWTTQTVNLEENA